MKPLPRIANALLIIGGLNWGLMGFFQYDLVASIFGGQAANLSRIIYSLVGLSALYQIFDFPKRFRSDVQTRDSIVTNRIDRAA
jgi:uncharacterized membrane protein YuzA (DUF378 family)